jgi:hypothetical protein
METFLRIAALVVGNIIGFSVVILAVRWYERRKRIAYERAMKRCSLIKFGIDFCNTRSQTVFKIVEKTPSGFEVIAEERIQPQEEIEEIIAANHEQIKLCRRSKRS